MHRRIVQGLIIAGLVVGLVACSPPQIADIDDIDEIADVDASAAWLAAQEDAGTAQPGLLASWTGATTEAVAIIDEPLANAPHVGFVAPFPTVRAVRAGCFGADGETADITWSTQTGSRWVGGGSAQIDCDGDLTEISLCDEDGCREGVAAFAMDATRDGDARPFYAEITGD